MDAVTGRLRPQTLDEIAALQHEIVELIRSIHAITTQAGKECAPILKRAEKRVRPLKRNALAIARTIDEFARRNKQSLTERGSKKTVKIPGGGSLQWRSSKPAVHLTSDDAVLAELERLGYEEFIRRSPSVNKIALAEHPVKAARVPGVRIEANRKFIIDLHGVPERIERQLRSKKLEIIRPKSRL